MLDFYHSFRKRDIPAPILNDMLFADREPAQTTLDGMSKVNIFIGANNSGKSRIIRELIKESSNKHYGPEQWEQISHAVQFFTKIERAIRSSSDALPIVRLNHQQHGIIFDLNQISIMRQQFSNPIGNHDVGGLIANLSHLINMNVDPANPNVYTAIPVNSTTLIYLNYGHDKLLNGIKTAIENLRDERNNIVSGLKQLIFNSDGHENTNIYIPALRTLRHFPEFNGEYKILCVSK